MKPNSKRTSTIGERIKQARRDAGMTQSDVAKHLHITRNAVTLWETGETEPTRGRIEAMCELFSCTLVWLQTGVGTFDGSRVNGARKDGDDGSLQQILHEDDPARVRVPRFAGIPTKRFRIKGVLVAPDVAITYDFVERAMTQNSYSMRVHGDQMSPKFNEGDLIFIEPQRPPISGDFVVVGKNAGDLPALRQLMVEGTKRLLKTLNPIYPDRQMDPAEEIMGVVVERKSNERFY